MLCDSPISQHTRLIVSSHPHNKGCASSFDLHTTSCLMFLDVSVLNVAILLIVIFMDHVVLVLITQLD